MSTHLHLKPAGVDKYTWRIAKVAITALVCLSLSALAIVAFVVSIHSRAQVQASCGLYRDLATIQIAPDSKPTLFQIVADGRVAYVTGGCSHVKGPLPPPDVRIKPYLPPNLR